MNYRKVKFVFVIWCVCISGCSLAISPPKSVDNIIVDQKKVQEEFQRIKANIQTKPDWLFPLDICPADVMPDQSDDSDYGAENCDQNPVKCYERCEKGKGSACYGFAITLQENLGINQEESEALHLRACKLGFVSGCTNRAAAKYNLEENKPEAVQCSVETFEKTCEKDDPWGCTMFGFALAQGKGVERDFNRALSVLSKSCKYGLEDEACQNAKELEKQIFEVKDIEQKNSTNK